MLSKTSDVAYLGVSRVIRMALHNLSLRRYCKKQYLLNLHVKKLKRDKIRFRDEFNRSGTLQTVFAIWLGWYS